MDKETLSNYGWIVICVLVLAVMIALATPFGNFVADAVKSTTQGLFDVNQSALNQTGLINIDDNTFADSGNNGIEDGVNNQFGDIVIQGDYSYIYMWCKSYEEFLGGFLQSMLYHEEGIICTTQEEALDIFAVMMGCSSFAETGMTKEELFGMIGVNESTYNAYIEDGTYSEGWGVRVIDKNKTSYGPILESINGEPVTSMYDTFYGCTSLVTAPEIPNSITDMEQAFHNCTSLKTAPVIPNNVMNMQLTFYNCLSLEGTISINTNRINNSDYGTNNTCYRCFANADMTNIILTGSAPKDVLNLIGSTGNNWIPIE